MIARWASISSRSPVSQSTSPPTPVARTLPQKRSQPTAVSFGVRSATQATCGTSIILDIRTSARRDGDVGAPLLADIARHDELAGIGRACRSRVISAAGTGPLKKVP